MTNTTLTSNGIQYSNIKCVGISNDPELLFDIAIQLRYNQLTQNLLSRVSGVFNVYLRDINSQIYFYISSVDPLCDITNSYSCNGCHIDWANIQAGTNNDNRCAQFEQSIRDAGSIEESDGMVIILIEEIQKAKKEWIRTNGR